MGADAVKLAGAGTSGDQVTAVMLSSPGDELRDGRGADPAPRRSDRAAKRLRVDRVLDQREVRERVADLGALVQPERPEDLARWHSGSERVGDLGGDPVRLGVLVRERPDSHGAAGAAHRDQRLPGPPFVVAHAADSGLEDLRARAEVPSEHDLRAARVAL